MYVYTEGVVFSSFLFIIRREENGGEYRVQTLLFCALSESSKAPLLSLRTPVGEEGATATEKKWKVVRCMGGGGTDRRIEALGETELVCAK